MTGENPALFGDDVTNSETTDEYRTCADPEDEPDDCTFAGHVQVWHLRGVTRWTCPECHMARYEEDGE